jgi:hypothetical protein
VDFLASCKYHVSIFYNKVLALRCSPQMPHFVVPEVVARPRCLTAEVNHAVVAHSGGDSCNPGHATCFIFGRDLVVEQTFVAPGFDGSLN